MYRFGLSGASSAREEAPPFAHPSEIRCVHPRTYWVYILSSQTRVIYVGVTSDIERRLDDHRHGRVPGFTQKYRIRRLVYVEQSGEVHAALAREKQLKGWRRWKKVALIERENPEWRDLGDSLIPLVIP